MSCQQASRFITATATTTVATAAAAAKSTATTKRIATQTLATAAAAAAATTTTNIVAKVATKTTPVTVDGENVGVAAGKTNTPEDPYVFTETVAATPPILFNAQKSRARLSEAQHSRNTSSSNRQTVASKKSSVVAATAAATTTAPIAQLNGTITTTTAATVAAARAAVAAATATAKAQASLGAATATVATVATTAAVATTTTNFNNVTQSQRQPASQSHSHSQLQLQSTLQLQSQASPKRATNVCVVRPQQQQQQQLQQQQQQLKQQQAKLTTKHPAPHPPPPPPLYTHTPSLWQTPLLLDTTQKQQHQQQPQQQHQQPLLQQPNIVVATALVSPPISPASLTSPSVNAPPTAAVTAMVSPIVLPLSTAAATAAAAAMSPPKGGSLPPSKFHHTTLAQHLQKVECLKKKKSLPLACSNNNNIVVEQTLHKRQTFAGYSLTHPPPLTAFNTAVGGTAAEATIVAAAVEQKKHSADAVDDNSDLSEIPVNVIFRKPPGPVLIAGPAAQTPTRPIDAKIAAPSAMMKLGTVAPLTPPTPPTPPSAASSALLLIGAAAASASATNPIFNGQVKVGSVPAHAPAPLPPTAARISSTQNEQMSSKVANFVVSQAAAPKRRTPAANASCRKGNKTNVKAPIAEQTPLPAIQQLEEALPPPEPAAANGAARRRRPAPVAKRAAAWLFSENEPLPLDDVPYCLQTRWLHSTTGKDLAMEPQSLQGNRDREERIAVRKGLLRRQALQLLSTRPLQELPMRAARQRLQGIQSLLVKYKDHANLQQGIGIGNRCLVNGCKQPTLSMAAHCERHIVNNSTQKLFQPCVAWRVNGSACQTPVFDVLHTLALCPAHSQLRPGLELQCGQQLQVQQLQQKEKVLSQLSRPPPTPAVPGLAPGITVASAAAAAAAGGKRKRKTNPNANPVGRPLKRTKKQPVTSAPATLPVMSMTTLPPMSAVLQRKSSTTSLESIASNSQSSAKSHSALPPYTPSAPVLTMPQLSIIPPALAPLSDYQLQQQLAKIEQPEQQPHPQQQPHQPLDASVNLLANANFKADEISQIVAQLAAASSELHNNNNNNLHYNNNHNSNTMTYCSNNNSNSGSSSISCGFPSFNAAFGNAMGGQGQGHQQPQATSLHGNTALASTESLLSHHMFGICENSSAYASSEDTGLGGLSESELIGANDADDIALNGAHLLEEHDLVNVFDTLPDDAFNELFQSVQQAECEAMDRALEIADKNLKCLQQTIGGTAHDSAFLNDFLDVGDDLLVDAVSSVMNSPNTSGIDTSTLFVDSSGSSSTNGPAGSSSASVADIRGLVHI